jgi:hypothetical protein
MLDLTALVVSQRLMDEQFSNTQRRRPPAGRDAAQKPLRASAARALRSIADALEPAAERHPAR